MRLFKISLFVLVCIWPLAAQTGQAYQQVSPGDTVRIETTDGSELIGKIVKKDDAYLHLETLSGLEIKIPAGTISAIQNVTGQIEGGMYMNPDPNNTRLFLGPTGRTLKKGRGYFSAYEIFFPSLGYGINDYITMAGGMTLFPGSDVQIIYVNPKIRLYRDDSFAVATGASLVFPTTFDGSSALFNLTATYGSDNSALTVSAMVPMDSDNDFKNPILMIGGEVRISRKIKLITENWMSIEFDSAILSAGVRFFGQSLAADLGFFYITGSDLSGFPFLPWIGFAYNF